LSFQRARQLQNGARPRVDSTSHKPARIAMLEVQAGLISWSAEPEPEQAKDA
jgi:DNA-directed RNA polymerase subunit K/omega